MWNYNYIIPSIMILLVFLIYYVMRPKLPVRRYTTFVVLLLIDLATVYFDYTSSVADEAFLQHSRTLLYALNMAYFVFFIARACCFTFFTMNVLEPYQRVSKMTKHLAIAVLAVSEIITLSSPFTGAVFIIDGEGYHSGSFYNLLYYSFGFFLVLSFVLIVKKSEYIPKNDCCSLLAYQLILLSGIIIRYINPHLLIMDLFCLIAIIIIFLSFENPDRLLTSSGDAFNITAFQVLVSERFNSKRFRILSFVIHNYNEYRGIIGGSQLEHCSSQICRYLSVSFPNILLFYLENGRFALFGSEDMQLGGMSEEIKTRFSDSWYSGEENIYLDISFVQVDSGTIDCTADRLISMILIALDNAGSESRPASDDATLTVQMFDRQLDVKRNLETALERDEVEVFFQPIIDSGTGRIAAAEALARIKDENGNIIPPVEFIPMAEKDGQISLLGEQVFRKVCSFIKEHRGKMEAVAWINVNVSPYQFLDNDMPQRYLKIIQEYGIPVSNVRFEITEEAIVDYSLLKLQLGNMHEAGFKFVLDDYGSGYSNLIRLRKYSFENIKIDMEVVRDYCSNPSPILPAFVKAIKEMGHSVTAEGIEDESMAAKISELGCDYQQGYHYSKPLPPEEFLKLCGTL